MTDTHTTQNPPPVHLGAGTATGLDGRTTTAVTTVVAIGDPTLLPGPQTPAAAAAAELVDVIVQAMAELTERIGAPVIATTTR